MRRHARVLFAIAALASSFAFASTATAADECANSSFRAIQEAAYLTECRAYEMVSPPDKHGNGVDLVRTVQAAPGGGAVAYTSNGTFADAEAGLQGLFYLGRRSADGWSTEPVDAPQRNQENLITRPTLLFSSDLSKAIQIGTRSPDLAPAEGTASLYLRDNLTRTRTRLAAVSPGSRVLNQMTNASLRSRMGASADLSNFAFQIDEHAFTGMPDGISQVYEAGPDGHLRLASRLPDGSVPAAGAVAGAGSVQRPFQPVSSDGSKVLFRSPPPGGIEQPHLYMRIDGNETIAVSASHRSADLGESHPGNLEAMSKDANVIYFSSEDRLTEDAEPGGGLYRYDVPTDELTFITKAVEVTGAAGATVNAASADGKTLVFTATTKLTADAPSTGSTSLYALRGGAIKFLGPAANEAGGPLRIRFSPNGRYVAFDSIVPVTGYENTGPSCVDEWELICREVFRYDVVTDQVTCLTCTGDPIKDRSSNLGGVAGYVSEYVPQAVLDDGTVFFDSPIALVPEDTNERRDVYQWKDGAHSLVSSGRSTAPSYFADASADGRDVYFITAQRLVGSDVDGEFDLYDARRDGGIAAQTAPPPPVGRCEGEACRGAVGGPGSLPPIGSIGFDDGKGRARKAVPAPRVVGSRQVRGAAGSLRVRVPGRGSVSVSGSGLKPVRGRAGKAGALTLPVHLNAKARSKLRRQGALKVTVTVTYEPSEGPPTRTTTSLNFKANSIRKGH